MPDETNDRIKKKVDEAWKEAVAKDKGADTAGGAAMPEITFGLFISGLMMEALVALGETENPLTKKKEVNVQHAKFIIETLAMLKDKTKSNLDKNEADALDAILYDLRMRFVSKAVK